MRSLARVGVGALVLGSCAPARAEEVSIYKVDYPEQGFCGEEQNVTKSNTNPHYFFPVHFGGFHEGRCADAGYERYMRSETVEMHPVPGVSHNLTFDLYASDNETAVELWDAERKRTVKAKVCFPTKPAPLLVFGHGFDCAPADYAYFCAAAVTALVYEVSSGASFRDTDTANLAKDQAFLIKALPRIAATDRQSPLFGRISGPAVLGGHSMGGGTSVMAAAGAATPLALFAPGLYTIPNAKPFLPNVTGPALIVSGSDDCGPNALPKEAQPAFDGLSSASKVLVVLRGANHCQWARPTEKFGVCNVPFFHECAQISEVEQQELGVRLAAAFLRGLGPSGWAAFERELEAGRGEGLWDYTTGQTPDKKLHNDCPCKALVV